MTLSLLMKAQVELVQARQFVKLAEEARKNALRLERTLPGSQAETERLREAYSYMAAAMRNMTDAYEALLEERAAFAQGSAQ